MSDFWSRIAQPDPGEGAPAAPPAAQAWWQRSAYQQPAPVPSAPPQQEGAPPQQLSAAQSQERTQWARQPGQGCPGCGSDLYFAHPEAPQARARCYSCGYPQVQSGSGPALRGQSGGEVRPARQTVAASTSNYHPGRVFHHM